MGTSLALTAAMAVFYLFVVRLVDFNEKEPLWAVLLLFLGGALSATALLLVTPGAFLELSPVAGGIATELARYVAIGAGIGVLTLVGRARGFSEINGLLDGVVYGSAGGFGFATGLSFTRQVLLPTPDLPLPTSALSGYGELFLVGLADGVFGAMVGIGFAAALEARSMVNRVLGGLGGLLAAVAAHVGYDFIARANPFGEAAVLRKWVALLLPVLAVIMVIVFALRHEKGAIAQELTAEEETGAVSPDELSALQSFVAREREYFGRLLRFDLSGWSALRSLHNRQVQLALAKRKASLETDPGERTSAAQEVLALRKSVLELKQKLGRAPVAEGRS